MNKKIFEFNGSVDLLSRLLRESDTIDQIVNEAGGGKVRVVVEVRKPSYQVEDDLRWNEHHEARMDRIGQNGPDGIVYDILADHYASGDDAEAVGVEL